MPTSLRTQRILGARRANVRRQYNAFMRTSGMSAMAVDTIARLHNVSKATIYKDLKATRKEGAK